VSSPWRLLAPFILISTATFAPCALGAPPPPLWSEGTPALLQQGLLLREGRAKGDALVALARRAIGRPYSAFSLDQGPSERLRLDLARFDCFLFVEQLLVLVPCFREHAAAASRCTSWATIPRPIAPCDRPPTAVASARGKPG